MESLARQPALFAYAPNDFQFGTNRRAAARIAVTGCQEDGNATYGNEGPTSTKFFTHGRAGNVSLIANKEKGAGESIDGSAQTTNIHAGDYGERLGIGQGLTEKERKHRRSRL